MLIFYSIPHAEIVDLTKQPDCTIKYWIKDAEITLFPEDKLDILGGGWLTDGVMSAALHLLKKKYPLIAGLQPTSMADTHGFDIQRGAFVQVLNVYGSHWITVSSVGCPTGTVNIYDSLPNCALYSRTKRQIASIVFLTCKKINVNFVEVQVQSGGSDCGLFSLAFAASLCAGEDPSQTSYRQHNFRSHLVGCLEERNLTPFPKRSRKKKGSIRGTTSFEIYCICRLPQSKNMVACIHCKEWFHENCYSKYIPESIWTNKTLNWYCQNCVE